MKHYAVEFPRNIDLDQISCFIDEMLEQRAAGGIFWKGEDTPGDGIETVFARTPETDTIIGTVDVAEEMERLVTWLRALTTAGDEE